VFKETAEIIRQKQETLRKLATYFWAKVHLCKILIYRGADSTNIFVNKDSNFFHTQLPNTLMVYVFIETSNITVIV